LATNKQLLFSIKREQEQQLRLFQLYHNEKSAADVRAELETRQQEIRGFEEKRDAFDEEIRDKKKKQGQGHRELAKIEEQIKDLELKLSKRRPQFIKAKESSSHLVKKLETARTCHEAALKANQAHLAEIEAIRAEIGLLEAERKEFEDRIHKESTSQGINLELRADKVNHDLSNPFSYRLIILFWWAFFSIRPFFCICLSQNGSTNIK
jgi:structural maintenance of chromosome 1